MIGTRIGIVRPTRKTRRRIGVDWFMGARL
jgi:hypothetical protein